MPPRVAPAPACDSASRAMREESWGGSRGEFGRVSWFYLLRGDVGAYSLIEQVCEELAASKGDGLEAVVFLLSKLDGFHVSQNSAK